MNNFGLDMICLQQKYAQSSSKLFRKCNFLSIETLVECPSEGLNSYLEGKQCGVIPLDSVWIM